MSRACNCHKGTAKHPHPAERFRQGHHSDGKKPLPAPPQPALPQERPGRPRLLRATTRLHIPAATAARCTRHTPNYTARHASPMAPAGRERGVRWDTQSRPASPAHPSPLPAALPRRLNFPRTLCATYALTSHGVTGPHAPPARPRTQSTAPAFDPAPSASGRARLPAPPAASAAAAAPAPPPPARPGPCSRGRSGAGEAGKTPPPPSALLLSLLPAPRPGPSTWRAPRTTSPTCWRK